MEISARNQQLVSGREHSFTPMTILLAVVVVLATGFTQACASQRLANEKSEAPTAASSGTQGPEGGYVLKVTEGGRVLASLSIDDIKAVPSQKVTADGKEQVGPTLLSLLQRVGIYDFKKVTVVGMQRGRTHSASLPLERSKITDRVILDINRRGQTKLASPDIPAELWIVDISELEVER